MKTIIGHENFYNNIISLIKNKTLPNKILLSGQKGIGKSLLVNDILNIIYSNKDNENNHILIKNNSHPNINKIFKKTDKKNIEISQIRDMIKFQNTSSFNDYFKSIIIDDLEYLNINSINALLKVIEEPNDKVLFFLIHDSSHKITETLRSRCIQFNLSLKGNEVKSIVDNYFNIKIYDTISKDFINFYNSPSFLISLVEFLNNNSIDLANVTIEQFIIDVIKNKHYVKNQFIIENINVFIELFFYKNINLTKKVSYKIKEYFYYKLFQIKKYNLDLDTFFLEFEEKLLRE
tara:strand:+ start:195 stop:1067 length:873 start_codon:yes stop_codon:yes gene_type:complete